MTPFHFGTPERRLFGVYHPAFTSRATVRAVVLCYPWAHEYIYAHRSMVKLASVLAENGFHVLRFDYYGTGDSAGASIDVTLEGCREDILTAAEELMDMTGAECVSLIGLRLGASLAAEVAVAHRGLIDRLVMWDPVIFGRDYVEALYLSAANLPIGKAPPPERPAATGGGHEICGFPLTDAQREQISGIDLVPLVSRLPRRAVTMVTCTIPSHEPFLAEIGDGEAAAERFLSVPDYPAWHENWPLDAGTMPVDVINRIKEWMT
jgi:pimeloyl-ACP methyl ester carboxylesterase